MLPPCNKARTESWIQGALLLYLVSLLGLGRAKTVSRSWRRVVIKRKLIRSVITYIIYRIINQKVIPRLTKKIYSLSPLSRL